MDAVDDGESDYIYITDLVSWIFYHGQLQFSPSRDFGFLSAVTMLGALLGDLFFLPAVLTLVKPKIPHFYRSRSEE